MAPAVFVQAGAVALRRGTYCPRCEQRTNPQPYFSRGINVAKLAILLPFTFVGPILFFLIRKDRLVCSWCRALLPGELQRGMFDAFSPLPLAAMPEGALVPAATAEALMAAEEASHEIARLERRSRRNRARSWLFAIFTGLFGTLGGAVAAGPGNPEALFVMSGLSAAGGLATRRRGRRQKMEAEAKRQRQRVLQVLALARAEGGRLTVTTVSSHLALDFREAEALLDSMLDGRRVDVQADDQGRVIYVFPELQG
jgi:hypothetical protein